LPKVPLRRFPAQSPRLVLLIPPELPATPIHHRRLFPDGNFFLAAFINPLYKSTPNPDRLVRFASRWRSFGHPIETPTKQLLLENVNFAKVYNIDVNNLHLVYKIYFKIPYFYLTKSKYAIIHNKKLLTLYQFDDFEVTY